VGEAGIEPEAPLRVSEPAAEIQSDFVAMDLFA